MLAADEKMDRVLVPLIPNNAQVKLTVLEHIAAEGSTTTRDELHRTLRHELLMICHAMQSPHPSRTDMMKALRTMAYWPSAEMDVQYFCDTCAVCLANRSPMLKLGSTMTSTRRFGVMMIDKLVFDDDVALLVGMPAALLMTCPQISDAQIELCYSATAVEAARVIFVAGVTQFSIPMTIVSDSEPAFAAKVTQQLAKMFGVRTWDFGPVSSPQHHGKVERRVEPYNRAIKGAMAAGAITCRRTMEVVLAAALIAQTQLVITNGTSAFTRRTGAIPRTHRQLVSTAQVADVTLHTAAEEDESVLTTLQMYVSELCDWHQEMRDMTHRKSLYPKLSKIATQQGTDFYLITGDMVSYEGERWLLLEVTGSPNQEMTARIQQATHADAVATKTVRYDTLRPLASMREQLVYDAEVNVEVDDHIFFLQGTLVVSGQVKEAHASHYLVHLFDPSPQHKCYLPSWEKPGKPSVSRKKQPRGYTPELKRVIKSDIETVTRLTKSYQIPAQAWKRLQAKGVVLPLEYAEEHAAIPRTMVQTI